MEAEERKIRISWEALTAGFRQQALHYARKGDFVKAYTTMEHLRACIMQAMATGLISGSIAHFDVTVANAVTEIIEAEKIGKGEKQ